MPPKILPTAAKLCDLIYTRTLNCLQQQFQQRNQTAYCHIEILSPADGSYSITLCYFMLDLTFTESRIFIFSPSNIGDRGGTVVKVLCYKSEGR